MNYLYGWLGAGALTSPHGVSQSFEQKLRIALLGKKYKEGVALSLAICLSDARTWATLR